MTNSFPKLLQTFRHTSFRIYFFGQLVSLSGTWLQRIAEAWLAYQLTHSAFYLGLVGFMGLFPGIFSNLFAGALLDRYPKKTIIVITQTLLMLQAAILCWFTLTGIINIQILLVLSFFQALISGADMPARQTFLIELVGKEELPQAIALNSVMVNLGRILGPVIGAFIIPLAGEGAAFGLNAATYLVILFSFFWIIPTVQQIEQTTEGIFSRIRNGFDYVFGNKDIRNYLLLFGFCNLLGMFYSTLLPLFAEEKFGRGAEGLSVLMAASGIGAFSGAFLLGGLITPARLKPVLKAGTLMLCFSLIMMAINPWYFAAIGILFIGGLGMMIQIAGTNMLLQHVTSDEYRGRVMSFYTFTFTLCTPLGNLWAGSLAELTNREMPFLIGGVFLTILLFIFTRNRKGIHHART
ncbi:MAG: MFS transporter [Bacteroidetes bacterium]|nr:MFS transporter [Bacteroidota bacterium]